VPDWRVPFHRYAWISNYGEDLPPSKSALIAEITVPPSEKVDVDALKHETVRWLAELGVIREEDVAVVATWFHKYGYPIYTLSHSKDTQIIEGELRKTDIITLEDGVTGNIGTLTRSTKNRWTFTYENASRCPRWRLRHASAADFAFYV